MGDGKELTGERIWAVSIQKIVQATLPSLIVKTGHRLPYVMHVMGYEAEGDKSIMGRASGYQTDLLIAEQRHGLPKSWVPRVVVEFKFGRLSTHDALTYSAKAATHKNLHPYLRYGIVVGNYPKPVPRRLIRHGQEFDFMLTLPSQELSELDLKRLTGLLQEEILASQQLEKLLSEKPDVRLLHRKLAMTT